MRLRDLTEKVNWETQSDLLKLLYKWSNMQPKHRTDGTKQALTGQLLQHAAELKRMVRTSIGTVYRATAIPEPDWVTLVEQQQPIRYDTGLISSWTTDDNMVEYFYGNAIDEGHPTIIIESYFSPAQVLFYYPDLPAEYHDDGEGDSLAGIGEREVLIYIPKGEMIIRPEQVLAKHFDR